MGNAAAFASQQPLTIDRVIEYVDFDRKKKWVDVFIECPIETGTLDVFQFGNVEIKYGTADAWSQAGESSYSRSLANRIIALHNQVPSENPELAERLELFKYQLIGLDGREPVERFGIERVEYAVRLLNQPYSLDTFSGWADTVKYREFTTAQTLIQKGHSLLRLELTFNKITEEEFHIQGYNMPLFYSSHEVCKHFEKNAIVPKVYEVLLVAPDNEQLPYSTTPISAGVTAPIITDEQIKKNTIWYVSDLASLAPKRTPQRRANYTFIRVERKNELAEILENP